MGRWRRDSHSTRRRTGGARTVTIGAVLLFGGLLASATLLRAEGAAEPHIEVTAEENRYTIHFELTSPLPYATVYALITDYNRLGRLNPSITESRLVALPAPGEKHVFTKLHGCVLLFCETLKRVERVTEPERGVIATEIIPEQSDFRTGVATWRLSPDGEGTWIRYDAVIEPKRKLLPVVGPWLVRKHIKDELALSAERLRGGGGLHE